MRLADLAREAIREMLIGDGLALDLGAARVRIRSDVTAMAGLLQTVYGAFPRLSANDLFDVTVDLREVAGLRRVVRPQVELWIDGAREFEPFPRDTPLPLLEWGINFALATRLGCYLLLHSGALERQGRGLLLPAMPGSGKSTLTAALSRRGFRLLSDEFGVIRLADRKMLSMLRPVALKNESIGVLRALDPTAIIGPSFPKTRKGTVAHLAPQTRDVDAIGESVAPRCIVFPRFDQAAGVDLKPLPRAQAFARLAVNSFNYDMLGPGAFDALGEVVQASTCFDLRYGDLEGAIAAIDAILDGVPDNGSAGL